MSGNGQRQKVWTPANVVTFLRICLVPLFVVALLSPWPEWFGILHVVTDQTKALVAAGVFVVISCTDWIDGYLARSRGEVTDLGKFLDPLADKILVAAALIALVELRVIPSWPVLIILTREFIVSGIRMVAATKGVVIAASWYGKAKTVLQIVAIVLFLVKDSLYIPDVQAAVGNPLYVVSWLVMIAALVMTVLSMFDYIMKARPLLFPADGDEGDDGGAACKEDPANALAQPEPEVFHSESGLKALASEVVGRASEAGVTLACAESLTGGWVSECITSVPGSSAVFAGGFVTYATDSKHKVLGVGSLLLDEQGPVCEEVAVEMAEGAARRLDADVAVSVTGIAGPTGAEPGKPVGTVWMGVYAFGVVSAVRKQFDGDRDSVRAQTVEAALLAMASALESHASGQAAR